MIDEKLTDGTDPPQREAAVPAEPKAGIPRRADPVVVQEVIEVLPRVGTEDAVGLEYEQPLGGVQLSLSVSPEVREWR